MTILNKNFLHSTSIQSQTMKLGFTLIELLVVVAIIGMLSSIVLASLNTARAKGSDSNIKLNLANIRAQGEILFSTFGGYGVDTTPASFFPAAACASTPDTFFADTNVIAQITAAGNASTGGGMGVGSCVSTASAWAVSMPLKQVTTNSWCVDSLGSSRQVTPAGGDRGFLGTACK